MGKTKQNTTLQILLIGLKLLIICAVVAGIVSFVYAMTTEQYEKNIQETKNQAIGEIFARSDLRCEAISAENVDEVVYKVFAVDELIGYCVEVKSPGFGGDIEMMVGYTADCEILGVSIVSLSETPGLGAKVNDASFISQYAGKAGQVELGVDVDAVSGATISSRAVTDGVNQASESLQKVLSLNGGAIQ